MCGRYSLGQPVNAADRFDFVDWHERRIEPKFNVAPTQLVLTVVAGPDGREAPLMRWGFQPGYLKDSRLAPINAKAEALLDKPLFRGALARQRCLVVADGFFEWRSLPEGGKQPMYMRLKDGGLFAFAGLYSTGKDGTPPSCAIVTTTPNDLLAPIHARMPVVLAPEDEAMWLDPTLTDPHAVLPCLRPYPSELMTAFPVSRRVNAADQDAPELILPASELAAAL
jgi:putative SOS response-associated peptidase YedK